MDSREILSDEESSALRTSASPDEPGVLLPEGRVVEVHPDHWERIASDKLPALESISERLTSLLRITARRFLRKSVEVTPRAWRDERWSAYARRLPVPASLNVIEIRNRNLRGVLTFNAEFVFTLVDIFFGGDGKAERHGGDVEFSPMEVRLVRKFVTAIAQDMKEAWKPFQDVDFQLGKTEINPIFAAVAAGSDSVCISGFDLSFANRDFSFDIVLPEALVEPVRHQQDAGQAKQLEDSQRWQSRLKADVQDARVVLHAVIASTEISLRDIAEAVPGDIIPFALPENVTLYAGDTPLLEGSFGALQGRNAVRIAKPANRTTVGEKYGIGETR